MNGPPTPVAALPECLYLEATNRCNLSCPACLQHSGMPEPPRDLTLETARSLVAQLGTLQRVVLHGIGEPLLNCALPELVRLFKQRGIYVLFNSNGLLLDRAKAAQLIDSGLDELRVSMDAGRAPAYARMRGADRFDQLVANLAGLMRLRKERGSERPRVSAWMVGTRENLCELPALIELCARLQIDEVYLQRLVYFLDGPGHGLSERSQSVSGAAAQIQEIISASMQLSRRLGIALKASGSSAPPQSLQLASPGQTPWRRCRRPWQVAYVTVWGNLLPCCIAPFASRNYAGLIMGNIFRQSFAEIWNGAPYRGFRRRHQTGAPPASCRGCGVEWSL